MTTRAGTTRAGPPRIRLIDAAGRQLQYARDVAQVERAHRLVVVHREQRAAGEGGRGRGVQCDAVGVRGDLAAEAPARLQRRAVEQVEQGQRRQLVDRDPVAAAV